MFGLGRLVSFICLFHHLLASIRCFAFGSPSAYPACVPGLVCILFFQENPPTSKLVLRVDELICDEIPERVYGLFRDPDLTLNIVYIPTYYKGKKKQIYSYL